ncbi:hypothetical protein RTM1035_02275 [Roseovarius sp. TM1035]|nr:hypothetical protein RTM1035_02275 [Roseovarius sp. TM1035]
MVDNIEINFESEIVLVLQSVTCV